MAAPITETMYHFLFAIGLADPPIDSVTINRRMGAFDRPRRLVEAYIGKELILETPRGYVLTEEGRKIVDSRRKKKTVMHAEPRTFKKDGIYKGIKLVGIREGSLDFLSIPNITNGKEVEVHPCLKS